MFLKFLASIAPEGETLLFVRQKEKVTDLFDNAEPTYTWPAYLPSKYDGRGAWFVNSGCFVLDRMTDKISAARANCDKVFALMLDDIGTKVGTPTLPPTWIMETSAGNFQWVYVFALDAMPSKGVYNALYTALADAGHTDPGAGNPVRNMRLPGSINLKPNRGAFMSQLVEFHPEREFTPEQIASAFGVTPAPADTAEFTPLAVTDTGDDDVMAWLAAGGLVTERVNDAGWAGVVCPNAAEHTDGSLTGRYSPSTRAYKCLHAHCEDWTSTAYLEWVARCGGPVHQPGLRDTLIADLMTRTLGKLEPTPEFRDVAGAEVEKAETREIGRVDRSEWHDRFMYLPIEDSYFDTVKRSVRSRRAFDAMFAHVECVSRHGKHPRISPSHYFDEHRQDSGSEMLTALTYAPGEGVVCDKAGEPYGNRWVDARVAPSDADAGPWLAHLEALVPAPSEREHLLDVLAHKYQHPAVKINHAILLAGLPGSGKDTLLAPFFNAVCGPGRANFALVDTKTLESQFTYAFESEIMLLNELRPDEFRDRRALENKLKPIIAAPPEYLEINRKGLHPYYAVNRMLVVAFSNFRDAIALSKDDRRFFVLWTDAAPMSPAAAAALWGWYAAGGYAAVAGLLARRDVSAFNPGATPFVTDAKGCMGEASMSPPESWLFEYIKEGRGVFARGAIAAPFHALLDQLQGQCPPTMRLTRNAMIQALQDADWHDCGRIMSVEYPSNKHIYCTKQLWAEGPRKYIRALVESPVADNGGAPTTVVDIRQGVK